MKFDKLYLNIMMEGKTPKDKQKLNSTFLHLDFRVEDYKEIASSHLLGNYPIYSKLNSNTKWNDARLRVLRPDYFVNKVILDIGCNEGILAIPIALKLSSSNSDTILNM